MKNPLRRPTLSLLELSFVPSVCLGLAGLLAAYKYYDRGYDAPLFLIAASALFVAVPIIPMFLGADFRQKAALLIHSSTVSLLVIHGIGYYLVQDWPDKLRNAVIGSDSRSKLEVYLARIFDFAVVP